MNLPMEEKVNITGPTNFEEILTLTCQIIISLFGVVWDDVWGDVWEDLIKINSYCLEDQFREEFVLAHFVWGMHSVGKCL